MNKNKEPEEKKTKSKKIFKKDNQTQKTKSQDNYFRDEPLLRWTRGYPMRPR